MPRFHQAALELIITKPGFSDTNARILAERERISGRSFPAAVREWYSFDRSVELLQAYSNCDWPVPLDRLGAPAENWYGAGPRDFLQGNLLWFMTENQGVCNWAVKLDGSDDPPVMVEVDSAPNDRWRQLTASFSEFIFCQIWDHPPFLQCCAQEGDLAPQDLQLLNRQFASGPITRVWPGSFNRRFSSADGRVLIWSSDEHGADWFLFANGEARMENLLRSLWQCGNLPGTLYGIGPEAERALARVRKALL